MRLVEDRPLAATIEILIALLEHWGVSEWSQMEVFGRQDVTDFFKGYKNAVSILLQKRVRYIVEFARRGTINDSTSLRDIISIVDTGIGEKRYLLQHYVKHYGYNI